MVLLMRVSIFMFVRENRMCIVLLWIASRYAATHEVMHIGAWVLMGIGCTSVVWM